MAEGRHELSAKAVCAEQYLEMLTPQAHLPICCRRIKKNGWAFYLHYTKDALTVWWVSAAKNGGDWPPVCDQAARGRGYGAKMLDFCPQKAAGASAPDLGVLNTNTRAIALYKRMGWRLTGSVLHRYDPADANAFAALYCEELKCAIRADRCFVVNPQRC